MAVSISNLIPRDSTELGYWTGFKGSETQKGRQNCFENRTESTLRFGQLLTTEKKNRDCGRYEL